jgi:hypothetical protein
MSTQTTFKTAGATSRHVDIELVQKAAATSPGDPLTGLVFNTSGLTAYYRLGITGVLTAITLATQTVTGAYSSGGFVEIDSTHAPGGYRFDIPNACIATAGECNIWLTGAANLATHHLKIIVEAVDMYTSTNVAANVIQTLGIASLTRYVGTALAGSSTTITLAAGTTALQCVPGDLIRLTAGTGAGQVAAASAFNSGSGVATIVGSWPISNPDNTTQYEILKVSAGIPATPADIWGSTDAPVRTLTGAANITSTGASIPLDGSGNVQTDAFVRLGAPAGASVSSDIGAVKTDTGNLVGGVNVAKVNGTTVNGAGTSLNPWGP